MSTTDPAAARRARAEALQGSPRALVMTLVTAVLLLAAGAVVGYALGSILGVFRGMFVNSIFSDTPDPAQRWWAMPLAFVGSFVTFGLYSTWNHRYSGRASTFVGVGPLTIWLAGAAASLWWTAATVWPAPDRVGTAVDPAFGHDEAWGVGAWIWYTATWWLPALVSVLALVSLVAGAIARFGRGGRRGRVLQLLREGRRTEGTVTAVSGTTSGDATFTLLRWTFTFTDLQGQQRWVERTEGFRHGAGPFPGVPVTVLFDPAHPGDKKRIFTATSGGDAADDYLRPGSQ